MTFPRLIQLRANAVRIPPNFFFFIVVGGRLPLSSAVGSNESELLGTSKMRETVKTF